MDIHFSLDPNRYPDAHETLHELIKLSMRLRASAPSDQKADLEFWKEYFWKRLQTDVEQVVERKLSAGDQPNPGTAARLADHDELESVTTAIQAALEAIRTELEALRLELARKSLDTQEEV